MDVELLIEKLQIMNVDMSRRRFVQEVLELDNSDDSETCMYGNFYSLVNTMRNIGHENVEKIFSYALSIDEKPKKENYNV